MNGAEVVVVGGGAVGSATAYYLSKKGMDVILLEKGSLASGTSGRCDGNVLLADKLPGFDSQLNKASQDLFHELSNEIGYDIGWHRRGSLTVMESDLEVEIARDFCKQLVLSGLPVRMLDKKEVHEDEPNLAEDIAGGMEVACDGSLNPMALVHGLAYAARKLGTRVICNTTVTGIRVAAGKGVEAVETDGGLIPTKHVVCCAGIWSPRVGAMVGIEVNIKPRQGQILVSEKSIYIARRKVTEFGYLAAKFENRAYKRNVTQEMEEYGIAMVFEPTKAGNFLIGSSRRFDGENISSHRGVIRCLAQRAIRFFPIIREIKVIRNYAGLRPYTPDHLPIISSTRLPGFWVAAGHEGDGIGLSLITGVLVSQMICNETTILPIERLSISRFPQSDGPKANKNDSINEHT